MKRTKQCPKCQSLRIGYLAAQLDADDRVQLARWDLPDRINTVETQATARYAGIHGEPVETSIWSGDASYRRLVGPLEAYICTECGYFETFVKQPQAVDWNQVVGFSWVNDQPPDGGPFR